MKICTKCDEKKPMKEFIKVGLYYQSMCNTCRKDYNKKNNEKIKKLKNQKQW